MLTGCTSQDAPPGDTASEFGHVHGLGYDPGAGIVFAATHLGVWALPASELPSSFGAGSLASPPDGVPLLIEDRRQDTMGFFVTNDGLLLASGHPDPTDTAAPTNLGLISSDTAAREWTTVSLAGEADFHDIAATTTSTGASRIYGYDATRGLIRISDDGGTTWSDGATMDLRDLTIDSTNPDRVYATTASGVQISDDAARTFTAMPDAPALFLIATTDTGLVGIDTSGVIWASDGAGWIQGGTVTGEPQALAFVSGSAPWLLISDDRGVVATADLGATTVPLVKAQ
ncbi:hypothetical protein B5808_19315 (plasmid) [Cnuibacter physcomitrellae]|uniref:Exo-alpha-sialidase n=2 Tax=Cnuibacter physcomitrellae TaxID=1619308 RepID=A0A1X9LZP8_9MICO|nr:hypothetical protein B5808_19315 [Cnuibacter physcomitrellae]